MVSNTLVKLDKPEVSVIIPAYNEATYIGRLLDALCRQYFQSFEVIVSDAESQDGTEAVVARYADRLTIQFVTSPPRGPAAGRNRGAQAARGQWLLFLDADDDITDPEFIAKMVATATKRGWYTASSKMQIHGSWLERLGKTVNYHYIRLLARTKHPVAPGWCILTRRSVFEEHRGFNEKIYFGEDYDYVSRSSRGRFGFVESTFYWVDLRRARAEGLPFVIKCILNEVYRHTHGYNLESNPFRYEFGKHKTRS